eukprot:g4059.t1
MTEISESYNTKIVAIVFESGAKRALSKSEFEDFYTSRRFSGINHVSAFIPFRGGSRGGDGIKMTKMSACANYSHHFSVGRNGQPQHTTYKLGAPIGFPSHRSTAAGKPSKYLRGKTRSTDKRTNTELGKMIQRAICYVEKSRRCRVIELEALCVRDIDGMLWLSHATNIRVVPFETPSTKSPKRRWAHQRSTKKKASFVDDDDEEGVASFLANTAPGRFDFMDPEKNVEFASSRFSRSTRQRQREGVVFSKSKPRSGGDGGSQPKTSSLFSLRRNRGRAAETLGSTQHTNVCPGDFCDMHLESQAAVLRGPSEDDATSTFETISRRYKSQASSERRTKHHHASSSSKLGTFEMPYSTIDQARREKRLVRLLLERQARGEPGDYLTDEFQAQLCASPGRTLPAHYYRRVRVCDSCFRMYSKITALRSEAVRKIEKRRRVDKISGDRSRRLRKHRPPDGENKEEVQEKNENRVEISLSTILSKKRGRGSFRPGSRRKGGGRVAAGEIRETVESITKTDLAELRAYPSPPVAVQMVVSALTVLLTGEPLSWSKAKKLMANGDRFLTMMTAAMDHELVKADILHALEPFLRNSMFKPAVVRPINTCAARLCAFVRAVAREAATSLGRLDILDALNANLIEKSSEDESSRATDEGGSSTAPTPIKTTFPTTRSENATRRAAKRSDARRQRGIKQVATGSSKASHDNAKSGKSKTTTSHAASHRTSSRSTAAVLSASSSLLCEGRDGRPIVSRFMQTMEPTRVAFGRGESALSASRESVVPSDHVEEATKQVDKETRNRKALAQRKYSEKLHDPYQLSKDGPQGMSSFQCLDGSTISYFVLGKPDINLTRTSFVAINDFFSTYEVAQIIFRQAITNEVGTQVLLLNLPGQAYTSLPLKSNASTSKSGRVIFNNEYYASRLHELLQHLERKGDFFSATRPFHLVGFGNGGNIATLFASRFGRRQESYNLRSLVLLNSFANVDRNLSASLRELEDVFLNMPNRPNLPEKFMMTKILSREYLDSVGRDMAMNLLTAITNPITIAERLLIIKGAMHHKDAKGDLVSLLRVPMIIVHSTENEFVPPSQVNLLTEGRAIDQIYAHEEINSDSLSESAAKMMTRILENDPRRRMDSKPTAHSNAVVLWLKAGHELCVEAKKKIIDLFRHLASHVEAASVNVASESTSLDDAEDRDALARELEAVVSSSTRSISTTEASREYEETLAKFERERNTEAKLREGGDILTSDPSDVYGSKKALSSTPAKKSEPLASKGEKRLPTDANDPSTVSSAARSEFAIDTKMSATSTKTPDTTAKDPFETLFKRIEESTKNFEEATCVRAESLRVKVEQQRSTVRDVSEARRVEWEREDLERLDHLETEMNERKRERERDEKDRSSQIEHYSTKSDTEVEDMRTKSVENSSSASTTPAATEGKDAISTTTLLDQLEREDEKNVADARAKNAKIAEEEVRKREDFERTMREMREAEKDRQLDIARQDALEEQELRDEMIVHIQKIVRGIFGRRRAALIREEKEMEEVYAISALRMTSIARMFLAKLKVRNIKKEHERLCAATIIAEDLQRIFRGFRGRAHARKLRHFRSAENLQRIARGFIGRRRFRKAKKREARRRREVAAAVKMQSVFRMHRGMVVYQQRLLEDIATTTIQKVYRGVLGRRQAKRRREWQSAEPGPERLELGIKMVQRGREQFDEHRQEIEKLHREQEKTEARVSLIHAGLRESEKELATL